MFFDSARQYLDHVPRALLREPPGKAAPSPSPSPSPSSSAPSSSSPPSKQQQQQGWRPFAKASDPAGASRGRRPAAGAAATRSALGEEIKAGIAQVARVEEEVRALSQDLALKRTVFRAQLRELRELVAQQRVNDRDSEPAC